MEFIFLVGRRKPVRPVKPVVRPPRGELKGYVFKFCNFLFLLEITFSSNFAYQGETFSKSFEHVLLCLRLFSSGFEHRGHFSRSELDFRSSSRLGSAGFADKFMPECAVN